MLEVLTHILVAAFGFFVGAFTATLRLVLRHRRLVAKMWDWALDAFKDGKITKEELGRLFVIVGSYLEEEDKREFDRIQTS